MRDQPIQTDSVWIAKTLGFSADKRGNAVIATTQREKKMAYYKKFKDAVKARQEGQVTLYSAKMNRYYNGVAL